MNQPLNVPPAKNKGAQTRLLYIKKFMHNLKER